VKGLLFYIAFIYSTVSVCQIIVQNPSFEAPPPQAGAAAAGWNTCYGTPDIQPGAFCVNTPPADGNSYAGIAVNAFGVSESIQQQLSSPMIAGVTYRFDISVANFSEVDGCGGCAKCNNVLEVWGATSNCGQSKLLFTSDTIKIYDSLWRNEIVEFTADSNYTYIHFFARNLLDYPCPAIGYIFIDKMSPLIYEVRPVLEIASPSNLDARSCAFTVSGTSDSIPISVQLAGNFTGAPITATLLTDSTWSADVSYAMPFAEADTLIAIGTYSSGYVGRDTVVVNVNCAAPLPADMKIPNLFTPNEDGCNDVFVIENIPVSSELIVFNRWGKQIYRSENYANNWNGDSHSDGLYFFHLKLENQVVKGWIEIRR